MQDTAMPQVAYTHNGSFKPEGLIELFTSVGFNRLGEWNLENVGEIFRNTDYYVLATEGGELIGFVRLLTDWHTRGYISNLCVAPGYRDRGIGRSLMKEILSVCDEKKILVLNVYDTSGAPGFYKTFGFDSDEKATGLHRVCPARKTNKK